MPCLLTWLLCALAVTLLNLGLGGVQGQIGDPLGGVGAVCGDDLSGRSRIYCDGVPRCSALA